jgi:hypothetical protein
MNTGPRRSGLPVLAPATLEPGGESPLSKQYGMALPLVYGTGRVTGKLLWIGPVTEVQDIQVRDSTIPGAWKPGPGKVAPALLALCEGPIQMVMRAWRGGDCVASLRWLSRPIESGSAITALVGDGTEGTWSLQTGLTTRTERYDVGTEAGSFTVPDPSTAADGGAFWQIGGPGEWIALSLVGGAPGSGQYSYSAGTYTFPTGGGNTHPKRVVVVRNLTGLPGWVYPMSYRNTAQLRFDALVVSEDQLPDYQFELIGLCATVAGPSGFSYGLDCDPADVLLDILAHLRRGLGWSASQVEVDIGPDGTTASGCRTWCEAMGFRVSRAITERVATSQLVEELLDAIHARAVWSEGKLKVIPLGEVAVGAYTPAPIVASIGYDDLIVARGSDPVQVSRVLPSDTFTCQPVTWTSRGANYQDVTVEVPLDDPYTSSTAAYTGYEQPAKLRRADARKMPWVSTPAHAARLSWLLAMRSLYVRNTYRFTLGPRWAVLEPGDMLAITDDILGLDAQRVRITSIEERETGELECYAEEAPFSQATIPTLTVQTNDGLSSVAPAPARGNLAALPGAVGNSQQTFSRTYFMSTINLLHLLHVRFAVDEPDTAYSVQVTCEGSDLVPPDPSALTVYGVLKYTYGCDIDMNGVPGPGHYINYSVHVANLRNGG